MVFCLRDNQRSGRDAEDGWFCKGSLDMDVERERAGCERRRGESRH